MQTRDSDDAQHAGLDLKDDTVGESVHETTPRVLRHCSPRIGILGDTTDGSVDLLRKLKAEAGLAILVVLNGVIELLVGTRVKVESH
jgi:hypothetical protein